MSGVGAQYNIDVVKRRLPATDCGLAHLVAFDYNLLSFNRCTGEQRLAGAPFTAMDSKLPANPAPPQSVAAQNWQRESRKIGIALAKMIIPRRLIQEVRRYRRFKRSERSIYLKVRLTHELRLASRKVVPPTARSFVFVCFGNIMRSPVCGALFREAIKRHPGISVQIQSAGLNATPGRPAHPWAITAAQELGIYLDGHQAVLLTRAMIEQADAVIAMDFQNQVELLSRYPDCAAKFFLLGAYSGKSTGTVEIQDPFFGDLNETRRCYQLLQICTQRLADSLHAGMKAGPVILRGKPGGES